MHPGSWDHLTAEAEQRWTDSCVAICQSEELFAQFRRHDEVCSMTETLHADAVEPNWRQAVATLPRIREFLPQLAASDRLGNPHEADTATIEGCVLSGTLAHSCLVAALIEDKFGSLTGLHIAEIGGGYGSLAHVLRVLHPGIASYTLFDLPGPSALQRKYLTTQGHSSLLPALGDPERGRYDLVISWCSLSELNRSEQAFYIERVLKQSSRGFHGWNWKDRSEISRPVLDAMIADTLAYLNAALTPCEVVLDGASLDSLYVTILGWGFHGST